MATLRKKFQVGPEITKTIPVRKFAVEVAKDAKGKPLLDKHGNAKRKCFFVDGQKEVTGHVVAFPRKHSNFFTKDECERLGFTRGGVPITNPNIVDLESGEEKVDETAVDLLEQSARSAKRGIDITELVLEGTRDVVAAEKTNEQPQRQEVEVK